MRRRRAQHLGRLAAARPSRASPRTRRQPGPRPASRAGRRLPPERVRGPRAGMRRRARPAPFADRRNRPTDGPRPGGQRRRPPERLERAGGPSTGWSAGWAGRCTDGQARPAALGLDQHHHAGKVGHPPHPQRSGRDQPGQHRTRAGVRYGDVGELDGRELPTMRDVDPAHRSLPTTGEGRPHGVGIGAGSPQVSRRHDTTAISPETCGQPVELVTAHATQSARPFAGGALSWRAVEGRGPWG